MAEPPPELLCAFPAPPSPARVRPANVRRCGSGSCRSAGARTRGPSGGPGGRDPLAAAQGAVVCLQELTLSPYFAITPAGPGAAGAVPEELQSGPTVTFVVRSPPSGRLCPRLPVRARRRRGWPGYNTAVVVAPDGRLVSRTRKLHIPITAGYHENRYFRPGPADDDAFPVVSLPLDGDPGHPALLGCPTCWDQWFPELARAYSLAGAEVLIYPTAIGSEPDHPDFDTQPLWQQVIVANGMANGTFMVAVNRIGTEPPLTFYGSSFISDPYGRVLVRAPRDRAGRAGRRPRPRPAARLAGAVPVSDDAAAGRLRAAHPALTRSARTAAAALRAPLTRARRSPIRARRSPSARAAHPPRARRSPRSGARVREKCTMRYLLSHATLWLREQVAVIAGVTGGSAAEVSEAHLAAWTAGAYAGPNPRVQEAGACDAASRSTSANPRPR